MEDLNQEIKNTKKNNPKIILNIILVLGLFVIIFYNIISAPLSDKDVLIHVSPKDTLVKISEELKVKKVIKYPFLFKYLVIIFSGDKNISSGDYLFKNNSNLIKVSWQVSKGIHGVDKIRVTLKEGITREEIANLLAVKISSFRKDLFLSDERSKEGYLFPDTYLFYPMSTTDEILTEISLNFNKKISKLNKDIELSGKNLSDIIIMASILEKEAGGVKDAPIISGILWKRLEIGMLLQVDAAPITYKEGGLPKNPISNPGLSFIKFAINGQKSPYLFYLHDNNGEVHYAEDFSEHRSNIARYLK